VVTIAAAPFRYRLLKPVKHFWKRKPGQREDPLDLRSHVHTWLKRMDAVLAKGVLDFTEPGNLLYGLKVEDLDPELGGVASRALAHDGEWLYDSNYEPETAWANHFAHATDASREATERFEGLRQALKPAREAFVAMRKLVEIEASPYYAVLALDGDDFGKWLTGQHRDTPRLADMLVDAELARQVAANAKRPLYPALHRELARRLASLAIELHTIVDEHLGRMVYSGGDDVLAFLPLATALPCARAIERAMRAELGRNVTASAGLAIAHMRTPLSRALDDARKAEKQSKNRRKNRLTVRVAKRSGAPVDVTFPWRVGEHDVIATLVEMLRRDDQKDETSRPLSRVDVAYRLEHEFRLLVGDNRPRREADHDDTTFDGILFERMRALLGKNIHGAAKGRVDRLLKCMEDLGSQDRMNLLLLLRFLMREEHGIDTVPLLEDLSIMPTPEERP
jgi:hypothetical protein